MKAGMEKLDGDGGGAAKFGGDGLRTGDGICNDEDGEAGVWAALRMRAVISGRWTGRAEGGGCGVAIGGRYPELREGVWGTGVFRDEATEAERGHGGGHDEEAGAERVGEVVHGGEDHGEAAGFVRMNLVEDEERVCWGSQSASCPGRVSGAEELVGRKDTDWRGL